MSRFRFESRKKQNEQSGRDYTNSIAIMHLYAGKTRIRNTDVKRETEKCQIYLMIVWVYARMFLRRAFSERNADRT